MSGELLTDLLDKRVLNEEIVKANPIPLLTLQLLP